MRLSICSDVFGKIPFGEMLDKVKAYGIGAVEITTGGWGGCHYVPSARDLLDNPTKLQAFKDELDKRNIAIYALDITLDDETIKKLEAPYVPHIKTGAF